MSKLKAAIASHINIQDGQCEVGEQPFWDNAPKGITPEVAEKLRGYESDYIVASAEALGEASKGYLEENADADMMVGSFSMGEGVTASHSFHKNDEGEEWSAVCSVDRELTGEDILSKVQDQACEMLGK